MVRVHHYINWLASIWTGTKGFEHWTHFALLLATLHPRVHLLLTVNKYASCSRSATITLFFSVASFFLLADLCAHNLKNKIKSMNNKNHHTWLYCNNETILHVIPVYYLSTLCISSIVQVKCCRARIFWGRFLDMFSLVTCDGFQYLLLTITHFDFLFRNLFFRFAPQNKIDIAKRLRSHWLQHCCTLRVFCSPTNLSCDSFRALP